MNKFYYPAVFQIEEEGGYSISFPDIIGCNTQGEDIEECYYMATSALGLILTDYLSNKIEFPKASTPNSIVLEDNQFVVLIAFDMLDYLKKNESKAVKKTLSIPSWLNEAAIEHNINFSQVLQEALKEILNIN